MTDLSATPVPIGRQVPLHLLRLAGPLVAMNISQTAMSLVDFLMVSQLGTTAQAAIVPAQLVFWLVAMAGNGYVTAVSTFASQSYGRERREDCGRYLWQAVYLCVIFGLLMVPLTQAMPWIFQAAGHDPSVVAYEVDYTQVVLLNVGFLMLATAIGNFFTGIHRPVVGFVAMAISNLFNVIANYALIFGHFGFDAMGVRGAAIGTLLAGILQCVILVAWVMLPRYGRGFGTWHGWQLRIDMLKRLSRVGLPIALQFIIDIFAWTVFTIFIVGSFGQIQMAAHNLTIKVLEVSFMPGMGMSMAITAAVGKCIGQNRHDLAKKYVRWGVVMLMLYMVTVGITLAVFRFELAGLFSSDARVIRWSGYLLILCALFQIFDAVNLSMFGALRGAGDTLFPVVGIILPGSILMLAAAFAVAHYQPQWQVAGPWVVATIYVAVFSGAMSLRYRFGPWQKLRLLDHEPMPSPPAAA